MMYAGQEEKGEVWNKMRVSKKERETEWLNEYWRWEAGWFNLQQTESAKSSLFNILYISNFEIKELIIDFIFSLCLDSCYLQQFITVKISKR